MVKGFRFGVKGLAPLAVLVRVLLAVSRSTNRHGERLCSSARSLLSRCCNPESIGSILKGTPTDFQIMKHRFDLFQGLVLLDLREALENSLLHLLLPL